MTEERYVTKIDTNVAKIISGTLKCAPDNGNAKKPAPMAVPMTKAVAWTKDFTVLP